MAVKDDILGAPTPVQARQRQVGVQTSQPQSTQQSVTTATPILPNIAAPTAPTVPAPTASTAPTKPRQLSYVDMFKLANPYTPPTPEQLAVEQRKRKRQTVFAAISDGISALANLYATSRGAMSAYNPALAQSPAVAARWEKIDRERQGKQKEYYQGYMRAFMADEENARAERNWRRQISRDKLADDRYKEQRAIEQSRYEDKVAADKEAAQVRYEQWQKTFDEGKRHNRAMESRTSSSVQGHDSSSDGLYELLGVDYRNRTRFDDAVKKKAKKLGIPTKEREKTPGGTPIGDPIPRDPFDIAAEIEQRVKEEDNIIDYVPGEDVVDKIKWIPGISLKK